VISVERGHDPRDYTLVAFGGAGPLHAARLAQELEISRVLVPRNPGILCALGLLLTDLRTDYGRNCCPRRPYRPLSTCQRAADLIFGALAPSVPDRVIAATNGANTAAPMAARGSISRPSVAAPARGSTRTGWTECMCI